MDLKCKPWIIYHLCSMKLCTRDVERQKRCKSCIPRGFPLSPQYWDAKSHKIDAHSLIDFYCQQKWREMKVFCNNIRILFEGPICSFLQCKILLRTFPNPSPPSQWLWQSLQQMYSYREKIQTHDLKIQIWMYTDILQWPGMEWFEGDAGAAHSAGVCFIIIS